MSANNGITKSSALILKHSLVNINKVIFDEMTLTPSKKYVISKAWYQENNTCRPVSIFIQTSSLTIYDITKTGDLVLSLSDNDCVIFEKLDNKSVEYIKSSGVTKQYNLKNVSYKTIVSEVSTDDSKNINALRLRVMMGENPTQFFVNGNKKCLGYDEVKDMLIKGSNIKVIFEVDGVIVDIKNNTLLTNVIPRQILIQKMKPLKTNLTEYSFVDSDRSESNNEVDDNDAKEAPLNTQTEYLDLNTTNNSESKKTKQKKKVSKKSEASEDESEEESENEYPEDSESNNSVDVENFLKIMSKKK